MADTSRRNSYEGWVHRIETIQGEIDAISEQAKEDKAPHRQDMAQVYKDAEKESIDVKALKAVIRRRRKIQAAKDILDKLDISERSNALTIEEALGPFLDTPLGGAARRLAESIKSGEVSVSFERGK